MKKITLSFLIFPLILLSQVSISAKDAYEIKSYAFNVPGQDSPFTNIIRMVRPNNTGVYFGVWNRWNILFII